MVNVIDEFYKEIADWCVKRAAERTTNGSYYVNFTDVSDAFKVSVDWVKEHSEDIADWFGCDAGEYEIDDESFGMWLYGWICCEHCGCQASSSCHCCEIPHPEEWDEIEEEEQEIEIKPTREVSKAIKNYNLHKIHTGSLSTVPNDRYIRSELCLDVKELNKDLTEKKFIMVLNHYEWSHACWTVWETPYMDFESIKEIYLKEHYRKLWDSSQLYYDDGKEVIHICVYREDD